MVARSGSYQCSRDYSNGWKTGVGFSGSDVVCGKGGGSTFTAEACWVCGGGLHAQEVCSEASRSGEGDGVVHPRKDAAC